MTKQILNSENVAGGKGTRDVRLFGNGTKKPDQVPSSVRKIKVEKRPAGESVAFIEEYQPELDDFVDLVDEDGKTKSR